MNILQKYNQQELLRMFYISGAIIFLIVGISNTITNYIRWDLMLTSMKLSSSFMNLFNYIVAVFFYTMFRGLQNFGSTEVKDIGEKEIDKILEEASS